MNHYKFPKIETLQDVLPYIKDYPEFRVTDKGEYTVVNYMVSTDNTFKMIDENDHGGAIRRECRGIKFCSKTGKILARPFHKFFNIDENEENQQYRIDLNVPHQIQEKLDGSMIHPIQLGSSIRWMTKMGITSVSELAEEFIQNNHPEVYETIAKICLANNWTPIFEFTTPQQRIVIFYDQPKLTLLTIRDNISGEYLSPMEIENVIEDFIDDEKITNFDVIKEAVEFSDIQEIVDHTKSLENKEGFVICFDNGHRIKLKADEYLILHRSLDMVRYNHHAIQLLFNEKLDDVIAKLYSEEQERVKKYCEKFMMAFDSKLNWLQNKADEAFKIYGDNRAKMSQEYMNQFIHKLDETMIYNILNGRDGYSVLKSIVLKHASSQTKFSELEKWFGIDK